MEPDRGTRVARIMYRIGQGISYLRPRDASLVDSRLRQLLPPEEWRLIEPLTVADRAHHLDLHDRLVRDGCQDQELLTAALLHDVGKAGQGVRVGLVGRTLAVLLGSAAPGLSRRIASSSGRGWRRTLNLAEHHASLGADLARAAGCSERVCWIIAHHHDEAVEDEALRLLQRADDGELR